MDFSWKYILSEARIFHCPSSLREATNHPAGWPRQYCRLSICAEFAQSLRQADLSGLGTNIIIAPFC